MELHDSICRLLLLTNTTSNTNIPNDTEIQPQQANYIKNFVDSFETALAGTDYQDKNIGWRKYANEKTFIDYMLLNEISKNVDGYRISTLSTQRESDGWQ
jgi:hypothetical protein